MRAIGIAIAVVVVAALGFAAWLVLIPGPTAFASGPTVALSDYKDANPTSVPTELAQADLITRGEYLIHAADCIACHTTPGGQTYVGGVAFNVPVIGTIYSTNITPDKETGIGNYSDQDFLNAVQRGKRRLCHLHFRYCGHSEGSNDQSSESGKLPLLVQRKSTDPNSAQFARAHQNNLRRKFEAAIRTTSARRSSMDSVGCTREPTDCVTRGVDHA
jgi:hypothetical protein